MSNTCGTTSEMCNSIKNPMKGSNVISKNCHKKRKRMRSIQWKKRLKEKTVIRRPYVCVFCHQSFQNTDELTNHFLKHVEDRTFLCDFKKCPTLEHDLHSADTPQPRPKVPVYKCAYCGRKFRRLKSCKKHIRINCGKIGISVLDVMQDLLTNTEIKVSSSKDHVDEYSQLPVQSNSFHCHMQMHVSGDLKEIMDNIMDRSSMTINNATLSFVQNGQMKISSVDEVKPYVKVPAETNPECSSENRGVSDNLEALIGDGKLIKNNPSVEVNDALLNQIAHTASKSVDAMKIHQLFTETDLHHKHISNFEGASTSFFKNGPEEIVNESVLTPKQNVQTAIEDVKLELELLKNSSYNRFSGNADVSGNLEIVKDNTHLTKIMPEESSETDIVKENSQTASKSTVQIPAEADHGYKDVNAPDDVEIVMDNTQLVRNKPKDINKSTISVKHNAHTASTSAVGNVQIPSEADPSHNDKHIDVSDDLEIVMDNTQLVRNNPEDISQATIPGNVQAASKSKVQDVQICAETDRGYKHMDASDDVEIVMDNTQLIRNKPEDINKTTTPVKHKVQTESTVRNDVQFSAEVPDLGNEGSKVSDDVEVVMDSTHLVRNNSEDISESTVKQNVQTSTETLREDVQLPVESNRNHECMDPSNDVEIVMDNTQCIQNRSAVEVIGDASIPGAQNAHISSSVNETQQSMESESVQNVIPHNMEPATDEIEVIDDEPIGVANSGTDPFQRDACSPVEVLSVDQPFICHYCGKEFFWINDLIKHMEVHEGENCVPSDMMVQNQELPCQSSLTSEECQSDQASPAPNVLERNNCTPIPDCQEYSSQMSTINTDWQPNNTVPTTQPSSFNHFVQNNRPPYYQQRFVQNNLIQMGIHVNRTSAPITNTLRENNRTQFFNTNHNEAYFTQNRHRIQPEVQYSNTSVPIVHRNISTYNNLFCNTTRFTQNDRGIRTHIQYSRPSAPIINTHYSPYNKTFHNPTHFAQSGHGIRTEFQYNRAQVPVSNVRCTQYNSSINNQQQSSHSTGRLPTQLQYNRTTAPTFNAQGMQYNRTFHNQDNSARIRHETQPQLQYNRAPASTTNWKNVQLPSTSTSQSNFQGRNNTVNVVNNRVQITPVRPSSILISDKESSSSVNTNQTSSPDGVRYKCPQCDRGFMWLNRLKKHLETHPSEYICTPCNKTFVNHSDFKQHLLAHTKTIVR